MDILTSKLPTKIKVGDRAIDINYDYKTCILILKAFEDSELTNTEKVYITLKNLYKEDISDEFIEEAYEKAIKFLNGGNDELKPKKDRQRIYSFTQDASYIFTGINSSHHVDIIENSNLHFWKFLAFFMDMSTECMFSELVYYRIRKSEGKLTKEEKKQYNKIKDIIELNNEEIRKNNKAREEFLAEFYS